MNEKLGSIHTQFRLDFVLGEFVCNAFFLPFVFVVVLVISVFVSLWYNFKFTYC